MRQKQLPQPTRPAELAEDAGDGREFVGVGRGHVIAGVQWMLWGVQKERVLVRLLGRGTGALEERGEDARRWLGRDE